MRKATTFALCALLGSCAAMPVMASCGPYDAVIAVLEEYNETPQVLGITAEGTIMQVYADPITGTFTVLETMPDGTTCIRTDGGEFMRTTRGDL